jgi:hypothetical protein
MSIEQDARRASRVSRAVARVSHQRFVDVDSAFEKRSAVAFEPLGE